MIEGPYHAFLTPSKGQKIKINKSAIQGHINSAVLTLKGLQKKKPYIIYLNGLTPGQRRYFLSRQGQYRKLLQLVLALVLKPFLACPASEEFSVK